MNEVKGTASEQEIRIALKGQVDSNNAAEVEKAISEIIGDHRGMPLILDADELKYISSAGLRVVLHLKKTHPDLSIINTKPEVYEILDMTGFTQMITVEKAYRVVSIDGCEEIGRGANGTIYRIDEDNVVKVYNNADALSEIQHEREVARLALILGIPTAISYDVVRVGESYGSVFELLNARSFSKIIAEEQDQMDWCVKEYIGMLKLIHRTLVPKGDLPDLRDTVIGWAEFTREHLPEDAGNKLISMVRSVPQDDHMIHGDYHTKNLMLQGDEVLLIDMDTLAVGHPVFELASMFNAFIGFSEMDPTTIERFQGFDIETSKTFWHKSLAAYLGTDDEEAIREVEDKARIVGYTRLIRRSIRRGGLEDDAKRAEIEHWKAELLELLDRVDSLTFATNEIGVPAETQYLDKVLAFIDKRLEDADCPPKAQMQINLAVEEIFVNIANYAYKPGKGDAVVRVEIEEEPKACVISFYDRGVPYDPLAKADPDVTLSAEERQIGGLGIFMVKKTMDDMQYCYEEGQNILRIKKLFA